MRSLIASILVVAWVVYVATTSYIVWRILAGDTPSLLKNYTIGTNAAWVMMGIMLWVATEWFREFKDRS